MARPPRVHFPNAFYHVMLRGNGGQDLFYTDKDRYKFYNLLQEGISKFNFQIHGFCLMSNHVHLIIQVNEVSLSKIMQNVCFRYAAWINKCLNRVGHLFQGRFKAKLIDSDFYCLQLIHYIHSNPVKANIVTCMADYKWSSHSAYINNDYLPWLTIDFILDYFNENRVIAVNRYKHYMSESIDHSEVNLLVKINSDINNALQPTSSTLIMDIDTIVDFICQHYNITKLQLQSATRVRSHAKLRTIIAWLVCNLKVGTLTAVATYFKRDVTGIIRNMRRFEIEDEGRRELVEIKNLVIKSTSQA